MNKLISTLTFLFILTSCAQSQPVITTLILVRHAEKDNDGTKDPALSEEGKVRAGELVKILGDTKIDAIYSTPYKRTESTVAPLSLAKNLKTLSYEPMKGEEMDKILEKHKGGTIVICGHSNTTPWVANYFSGNETYKDFDDADYDNLLILSVAEKGTSKVAWLNYGKPTPQ